jgi:ribosomal peptide maturation radical SAM protein 1
VAKGERSVPRVLLAVMPFLPLHRPALGVSALKASCAMAGLACDVGYFTFDYAELIGLEDYVRLDGGLPTQNLTGEWIFSGAAFEEQTTAPPEDYLREVVQTSPPGFYSAEFVARLRELPDKSLGFVRSCVDAIDPSTYDIVGLTSTFQQNCASIALAREIKRRHPGIVTILGGGNCDGTMGREWLNQVPSLDIVVSGEADKVFPELITRLRGGRALDGLPGVSAGSVSLAAPPAPIHDLDALPIPAFDDYFAALARFSRAGSLTPELSVETSRGCWWGQKHHCTFCGLNGTSMAYRSKSPDRAFEEFNILSKTWGVRRLFASDNIINPRYFTSVFPRLVEQETELDIQYEMKSTLKRDQLRVLRKSGTTWFQPGIESLSTPVLNLMDKGVKAVINIQTLKWAREMGLRVTWNCLCGFPGEEAVHYERMLATMRYLTHLTPPASFSVFRLDRFSPMFDQSGERGLDNVRAGRAYRLCYPFSVDALDRIAYFFDYDRAIDPAVVSAMSGAWKFCNTEWQPHHGSSLLAARVSDSFVFVHDTRYGWPARSELLVGIDRAVLLAADTALSAGKVLSTVTARAPELRATARDVQAALDRLCGAGWILHEDGLYLSLTLFSGSSDDELGPPQLHARPAASHDLAVA